MSAYTWITESIRHSDGALSRGARALGVRQAPVFLVASVVIGAVLLAGRLDQGWWHHDDGSLGHSAERVLAGELPHRDFTDLYTGLLTFVNAAVFALLGDDLFNLRIPLALMFLVFVGCFFAIARRLISPVWAFVATLFAIAWSVPVYPIPIPSWYLLSLCTIGIYAVVRFLETRHRRWLLLAGLCGGVAVTIKIVGVWYLAAVLLALLVTPLLDERRERPGHSDQKASRANALAVMACALLVFVAVIGVMGVHSGGGEIATLLLPVAALCSAAALVGWRALRHGDSGRGMPGDIASFLGGAIIPIAAFVTPYVATGALSELVNGVLVAPQSRYEFASFSMPAPTTLLRALPVIGLFLLRAWVPERWKRPVDVVAASSVVFLVATAATQPSYSILWGTTRALAPIVIVCGAFLIAKRTHAIGAPRDGILVVLVLVAGFMALTQFPFAGPVYFCYVAPLVLLAGIACLRRLGWTNGPLPAVLLIALVVFGVRQLDNQSLASLGVEYRVDPQVALLDEDRASIRVLPEVQQDYARVRRLVAQHRGNGNAIFAGPDAPEIYFLTESRNPTPVVLDFLDQSGMTRGNRLIELLSAEHVRLVVVNHAPQQSPELAPATVERIRSMFDGVEDVGQFEVRWAR